MPNYTVCSLLQTNFVTEPTRQALTDRLNQPARRPVFFSAPDFALLQTVIARLIPQPDRSEPVDVAGGIDKRLTEGGSNGWRYDALPPDGDAYRIGLQGIDESARYLSGQPFVSLTAALQDAVLQAVQAGNAPGTIWQTLPAGRFFEELLAEAVELYYAHPVAQEELNYVGLADAPGWKQIGLDNLDERER